MAEKRSQALFTGHWRVGKAGWRSAVFRGWFTNQKINQTNLGTRGLNRIYRVLI